MLKFLALSCLLLAANFSAVRGQSDIQRRVDAISIGTSTLDDIKRLFGDPSSQRTGLTFREGFRNGTLDSLYREKPLNLAWVQQDIKSGQMTVGHTRTIHDLSYSDVGLVITLLDNPCQTHDIGPEDVRVVPSFDFTQIKFRPPDNLPPGACTIKISAHDQESNTDTFRIGNP